MHWLHTATFVPLAITGFVLYSPWLQSLAQGHSGQLIRLWHRIFAIGFGVVPIAYVIFQPRRAIMSFKEFMIGADDIEWIKGAVPYYLLGKHEAMPPPLLPGRDTPADEGWLDSIRFGYMLESMSSSITSSTMRS